MATATCGRTEGGSCTEQPFVVTEASTWIARGRTVEHAEALAQAWRALPDLPADAPLEARMARTRARVIAMRPINDAIQAQTERDRQASNFRFVEGKCADGGGDARDAAILRGRAMHGFGWDAAVRFADGWHAASAGWAYRPPTQAADDRRAAYDRGFAEGGGDPLDLFDAARRAITAVDPVAKAASSTRAAARPLPSSWPKPTDQPRPTRWAHRLLLLGGRDAFAVPGSPGRVTPMRTAFDAARAPIGAEAMTIILLTAEAGFSSEVDAVQPEAPLTPMRAEQLICDAEQRARLQSLLAGRAFDDIFIAAQGEYLRVLDAFAAELPLCRNMERTRNTALQQRGHLTIWLDRGIAPGGNVGAGHIRWGKVAKGLTAKLGEFIARYGGRAPDGGHLIAIDLADGPALGFVTAEGLPLSPSIRFTNKARLRAAMATALRTFGGATRLSASPEHGGAR